MASSPFVKVSKRKPSHLVDAGPLVGWLDADDQWHAWSVQTLRLLGGPLMTTESVFAEVCHHLREFRPALDVLLAIVGEQDLLLEPVAGTQSARLAELLHRYPKMDLGDATLVALSEDYPKVKLVTLDRRNFSVYRRKDGRMVSCIMPAVE